MIDQLAITILKLSETTGCRPVLVLPGSVALRPAFFAKLACAMAHQTRQPLEFQQITRHRSWVSRLAMSRLQRRVSQVLAQASTPASDSSLPNLSWSVSLMPSRPNANERFVVGYCDDSVELPHWTVPLKVTA